MAEQNPYTPTSRTIEMPDLIGFRADQAIQYLRKLGLNPITWLAEVDDVSDAGFVLGLDPPAGSPMRPKTYITVCVATHPDVPRHADDLPVQRDIVVPPPLTGPGVCDVSISPVSAAARGVR